MNYFKQIIEEEVLNIINPPVSGSENVCQRGAPVSIFLVALNIKDFCCFWFLQSLQHIYLAILLHMH